MYTKFKRVDSVTGILLFLFNVFLVEQGVTVVPLKKVFRLMAPFHKNETAIRMGLSRGVKNGLLVNYRQDNEVYYHITEAAVKGFEYWQNTLESFRKRIREQIREWDDEWSMVVINPADEKENDRYDDFIESLMRLGYGRLSNRWLWICPIDRSGSIPGLINEYRLGKAVLMFKGRLVEKEEAAVVASKTWPISSLAERYQEYLGRLEEALKEIDPDSDIEGCLPFLQIYGFEFFEIIKDDPQLPLGLLPPDWQGLKAASTFLDLRERIMPQARDYINSILGSN